MHTIPMASLVLSIQNTWYWFKMSLPRHHWFKCVTTFVCQNDHIKMIYLPVKMFISKWFNIPVSEMRSWSSVWLLTRTLMSFRAFDVFGNSTSATLAMRYTESTNAYVDDRLPTQKAIPPMWSTLRHTIAFEDIFHQKISMTEYIWKNITFEDIFCAKKYQWWIRNLSIFFKKYFRMILLTMENLH